jgi:integrase
MFTKNDVETSKGKKRKGLASISVANGYLRIRLRVDGQRQVMSLGLADTPLNRQIVEGKCRQINLDLISGNFDHTLAKYKPQTILSVQEPDIMPKVMPSAASLWEQYREYKASSLKPTTKGYHEALAKILNKTPELPITEALKIKAELEKVTTVHQTKRILTQLSAVCTWAVKHGLIESNPYEGMASEMPKFRYQLEPAPNAFTEEERDHIIEAFKNHKGNWNGKVLAGIGYSHYASLVEFWFLTGCRPSEAIGLQWKDVSPDCSRIHFRGAITKSGTGKLTRVQGSKNNRSRTFPCSPRLRDMLLSIRVEGHDPDALVFPAPGQGAVIYDNFCRRAWNTIVDPIKPDTTPYSCRDTFITTQILKGVPATVIAEWCDTSVEMIQKHYADFLKLSSLRPID